MVRVDRNSARRRSHHWFAALAFAAATTAAFGQSRPPTDPALASLIEQLTDRRTDDLVAEKLPDGGEAIDLKDRFQQVPLARWAGNGQLMVGCVASVAEASVFFGRDLYTGAPLPNSVIDERSKLAIRHGMTRAEYQFYSDLIERSQSMSLAKTSTLSIVNNDGAGEGFNSTAAQFLPAPGNDSNANLGAQRLALFNAAAQVWSNYLDSSVTIQVRSQFNPLTPCSTSGGVLGSAGSVNIFRDFANAGFSGTFYHGALANKQAGGDLSAVNPDINATFNSDVDTGCLGVGTRFYYGLDNATPAGTVNLFVVLLHEMGHGLGSSSFTSSAGVFTGGFPDIWSRFMFDRTVGLSWFAMTDSQRAASAINTNNLLWDGANVRIASGSVPMTAGWDAATGRVELFTPNPFQGGSSVSHYSNAAVPNLLMEPAINAGLPLTLDLTRQQMRDIGWYRDTTSDLVADTITNVLPSGGVVAIGSGQTISWTNGGSFARNVTIQLSLDAGVTWPITVASNIANTGSFAWTVPNNPTAQARLRVREHDFVAPLGQSAANFTIGANTAPTFTPAAAIGRQQGTAAGSAVTVGSVADAQTAAGSLTVTQIAGGTATGITVAGISNTSGTISATLAAACNATTGTVRFQVSDGSLTGTGDLQLNVSVDTPPVIGVYSGAVVGLAQGLTVNTASAPTDNGSVTGLDATIAPLSYTGTLNADPGTGDVNVVNAAPLGTYTVTVVATDNCASTTSTDFTLFVLPVIIFSDGFEL